MPATVTNTYSHKSNYTFDELSLRPHRRNECRIIPGAYTPKSATISISLDAAHLKIEYSVSETPGSDLKLSHGTKIHFGKHTKKVLGITFEYSSLEEVLPLMQQAANTILARQDLIPQDSIKRNYQMAAEALNHLRIYIQGDWHNLTSRLLEARP